MTTSMSSNDCSLAQGQYIEHQIYISCYTSKIALLVGKPNLIFIKHQAFYYYALVTVDRRYCAKLLKYILHCVKQS